MKSNFIPFSKPIYSADEIDAAIECFDKGWLGTGPKVQEFQSKFLEFKNCKFAVAVNSCTAALHLALLSLNIGPGDEVITTPMTFCATINTIIHVGAVPVLVDIDPISKNIDISKIEAAITPKTKCILPVHFAGYPCEMKTIMSIARKYDLFVIEDCAHAVETEYNGKKAGTFGDVGCFSFYSTKNLSTGEGGMLITNNPKIAKKATELSLHGMNKDAWKRFSNNGFAHYDVIEAGFKYNMMDLQAVIGLEQLKKIDINWSKRKKLWEFYQKQLSDLDVTLPSNVPKNHKHGYHLYTLMFTGNKHCKNRDQLLSDMTSLGVGVGVHYQSVASFSYYKDKFKWSVADFPVANKFGMQTISLSLTPYLTSREVDKIISSLRLIVS